MWSRRSIAPKSLPIFDDDSPSDQAHSRRNSALSHLFDCTRSWRYLQHWWLSYHVQFQNQQSSVPQRTGITYVLLLGYLDSILPRWAFQNCQLISFGWFVARLWALHRIQGWCTRVMSWWRFHRLGFRIHSSCRRTILGHDDWTTRLMRNLDLFGRCASQWKSMVLTWTSIRFTLIALNRIYTVCKLSVLHQVDCRFRSKKCSCHSEPRF